MLVWKSSMKLSMQAGCVMCVLCAYVCMCVIHGKGWFKWAGKKQQDIKNLNMPGNVLSAVLDVLER